MEGLSHGAPVRVELSSGWAIRTSPTQRVPGAVAEGFVGPEAFPVRPSATPLALDLAAGARIEGRAIVIPGGSPAVGATVRAGDRSTSVRGDGSYLLDAVRPGAGHFDGAEVYRSSWGKASAAPA